MTTDIYYFSGSGNSLVVARDIARELHGNLIPIPSIMNKSSIVTDAEVIGVVFPVFYAEFGGIPFIITKFIKKLENLGSKYIFAVCPHSGRPRRTIENFDKLLRLSGGSLAGGFTVKMCVPFSTWLKIKRARVCISFKY
jgi:flavodoxin